MNLIFDPFGTHDVLAKFLVGLLLTILAALWVLPNFVRDDQSMFDRVQGLLHATFGYGSFWFSLHFAENIKLPQPEFDKNIAITILLMIVPAIWLGPEIGTDRGMRWRIINGALVLIVFYLFHTGVSLLNEVGALNMPTF